MSAVIPAPRDAAHDCLYCPACRERVRAQRLAERAKR